MKMTILHLNAMIGLAALVLTTFGLGYIMIENELPAAQWMFVGALLKDCVLAIAGITWYFARRPPEMGDKEE